MILRYSNPKKIPYIDLGDGHKLIFSTAGRKSRKGYKYLSYSGRSTNTIPISGGKAKRKRTVDITENITFSTDMMFTKLPKEVKSIGKLTPITLGYLKKLFKELTVGDYFPTDNLSKLSESFSILDKEEEEEEEG